MFTATLSAFWPDSEMPSARDDVTREPPRKRPAPIFIGDAVQPFGSETLLLSILRSDGDDPDDTL